MDPIHPITPHPPALVPIADRSGSNPDERAARERREERQRAADRNKPREQYTNEPDASHPDEEDGQRHIDIRA